MLTASRHVKKFHIASWHDRKMNTNLCHLAHVLSCSYDSTPRLLRLPDSDLGLALQWRFALRQAGVPLLELGTLPAHGVPEWLAMAESVSREFMLPVVVAVSEPTDPAPFEQQIDEYLGRSLVKRIDDAAWLHARQVAITRAVETSPLNQELRRTADRQGWIRIGGQTASAITEGNGIVLAWSSPLPLLRIRNFSARCPKITFIAPDAEALVAEVAAHGISVSGWRFAVK